MNFRTLSAGLAFLILVSYFTASFGLAAAAASSQPTASASLVVSVSPPTLPADGKNYQAIYVGVASPDGQTLAAPNTVIVYLTSANLTVGNVDQFVTITQGSTFALASFRTTTLAGKTNITASTNGFSPAWAIVNTVKPGGSPSKLGIFRLPPSLLSEAGSQGRVLVELQNASGNLAVATKDVSITLTSSNPAVMTVAQNIVVPAGSAYASGAVTLTGVNGTSVITAQAPGLASASTSYSTFFLPLSLSVAVSQAAPLSFSSVRVLLNASSGPLPVVGASVSWDASSKAVRFQNGSLTTDAQGSAVAQFYLGDSGNITITAKVSAQGYLPKTAALKVSVKPQSLTIVLVPTLSEVNASQPTEVTATVIAQGKPLSGVSITWSSDLGVVTPPVSVTGPSGSASATFVSPTNGTANVAASVTLPGYGTVKQSSPIQVNLGGRTSGGGGGGGTLSSLFTYLPIILVLAVAVVLVLLVRRRRSRKRRRAAEKGGEDEAGGAERVTQMLMKEPRSGEPIS